MKFAIAEKLTNDDIKMFRKKYSLTQNDLANLLGLSKKTIEKWETPNSRITGAAVTALLILERHPQLMEELRIEEKTTRYRFTYMAGDRISTIIDVDYVNQTVHFKNYTNDVNQRAFGNRSEVTFQEFEDFLKSRCFPESRDKMKIQLKELNLPFYDPLLIVEKTEGRLVEDDFWIKIER